MITTILRYAWAAVPTLLGLLLALAALACGATARVACGALEVAGRPVRVAAGLLPRALRFRAITFGHVILGADHAALDAVRGHEHVHVRQYERWGPLFLPLYLASSAIALARGRDPYRDNRFEREAFAQAGGKNAG